MVDPESRSIPQLLGDFSSNLATLFRQESELVRAEFSEKISHLGKAGAEMAGGAICLLAALLVLLQALVIALSNYMEPAWAALLVGVGVAILGVVLIRAGARMASAEGLKPERAARQMEKDLALAKEQLK